MLLVLMVLTCHLPPRHTAANPVLPSIAVGVAWTSRLVVFEWTGTDWNSGGSDGGACWGGSDGTTHKWEGREEGCDSSLNLLAVKQQLLVSL